MYVYLSILTTPTNTFFYGAKREINPHFSQKTEQGGGGGASRIQRGKTTPSPLSSQCEDSPIAQVTAEGKQIFIELLYGLLLQHMVHPPALVDGPAQPVPLLLHVLSRGSEVSDRITAGWSYCGWKDRKTQRYQSQTQHNIVAFTMIQDFYTGDGGGGGGGDTVM